MAASPHRPILFQEPGEEMVPSKTPMVSPVTKSFKRVPVKLPVEPANRPVPPVTIIFSTMVRTPGAVSVDCPLKAPNTVSPLAAVNTKVPVAIPVARFTAAKMVNVNSPRWVASRCLNRG